MRAPTITSDELRDVLFPDPIRIKYPTIILDKVHPASVHPGPFGVGCRQCIYDKDPKLTPSCYMFKERPIQCFSVKFKV